MLGLLATEDWVYDPEQTESSGSVFPHAKSAVAVAGAGMGRHALLPLC